MLFNSHKKCVKKGVKKVHEHKEGQAGGGGALEAAIEVNLK